MNKQELNKQLSDRNLEIREWIYDKRLNENPYVNYYYKLVYNNTVVKEDEINILPSIPNELQNNIELSQKETTKSSELIEPIFEIGRSYIDFDSIPKYSTLASGNRDLRYVNGDPIDRTPKSDLEKFIELYKGFGIDCIVNQEEGKQVIWLNYAHGDREITESEKFDGYGGFHSDVQFDMNGKFLQQGFWE